MFSISCAHVCAHTMDRASAQNIIFLKIMFKILLKNVINYAIKPMLNLILDKIQ
jgi:hypothetical protein